MGCILFPFCDGLFHIPPESRRGGVVMVYCSTNFLFLGLLLLSNNCHWKIGNEASTNPTIQLKKKGTTWPTKNLLNLIARLFLLGLLSIFYCNILNYSVSWMRHSKDVLCHVQLTQYLFVLCNNCYVFVTKLQRFVFQLCIILWITQVNCGSLPWNVL